MKIISMLKLKKWSLEGAKLMAVFSIDLPGRVKNFELPRTKPLMPLFETIVNSIYAIEERQQNDDKVNGYINIEIIREPQMRVQTEGIDSSINDITGFVVTDNGIGFDENNMKSFLQSDSTYRAEKGGKGVGRFAWLKAFKEADIESSFIDAGEWVRRKFCFTLEQNEINDSLEDILHEAIYSAFANEMNPNSPLSSEVKAAMYILILVHNYPQSIAVFFADFREDLLNQLVDADAEFITERSFTEDDIDNSLFYISSFCYHFIEKKRKYVSNISLSIEDMRKYDSAIHSISQSIIYNQDTTIEKGNIIIQALKNIIMS